MGMYSLAEYSINTNIQWQGDSDEDDSSSSVITVDVATVPSAAAPAAAATIFGLAAQAHIPRGSVAAVLKDLRISVSMDMESRVKFSIGDIEAISAVDSASWFTTMGSGSTPTPEIKSANGGIGDGSKSGVSAAAIAVPVVLVLLLAAVAFIYVTRVRNAKDTAGGSSMPAAFENPMYDEPVQSSNSSMVVMMDDLHTKGLNDNALRSVHSSQSPVSTDETHNESSYLAVESTANSANVVVVDESPAGGSADEAFDGFGESCDADGGIDL